MQCQRCQLRDQDDFVRDASVVCGAVNCALLKRYAVHLQMYMYFILTRIQMHTNRLKLMLAVTVCIFTLQKKVTVLQDNFNWWIRC